MRRRLRAWLAVWTGWTALALFFATSTSLTYRSTGRAANWSLNISRALAEWWLWALLTNPRPTFGNFVGTPGVEHDAVSLAGFTTRQFSDAVSWADLDWFRALWQGPLAIKGIMDAEDARRAVERGVDAVIVSNHGGRQLDDAPSPIDVLPEVVDAVAGRAEVILDGGIRRGSDVVKAVALGARACMVGKAFN